MSSCVWWKDKAGVHYFTPVTFPFLLWWRWCIPYNIWWFCHVTCMHGGTEKNGERQENLTRDQDTRLHFAFHTYCSHRMMMTMFSFRGNLCKSLLPTTKTKIIPTGSKSKVRHSTPNSYVDGTWKVVSFDVRCAYIASPQSVLVDIGTSRRPAKSNGPNECAFFPRRHNWLRLALRSAA